MIFTLCLTHACNLRCAYCYAGPKFAKRMTWQTARTAIDFCLQHSHANQRPDAQGYTAQIGFFGGEPLLEWALLRRATKYADAEAGRLGIKLRKTLTTNMTLLDAAKVAWLKKSGFYVGLSLDGNAAMHNRLRRSVNGRGSHAVCARALRFFRGPGANAEVIVVVDPRNVRHLAGSVEWLISEDIRCISLNPNFYIKWPRQALAAWKAAYERVGDLCIETYRRGMPVRINTIDGKIKVRIKEGYAQCDRCGFGENEIAVSASGNIYPCERVVGDDTNEELRIGNVSTGFDHSKRPGILACRGNAVADCVECEVRDRCMNWCACINYATTGAINKVHGIVCRHEQMAIKVADRVGATLFAESNSAFLSKFYGYPGGVKKITA